MSVPDLRRRVFVVLEASREGDRLSRSVDVFLVGLVVLNVVASILETVDTIKVDRAHFFFAFEVFSIAVFGAEYLLRIWSCVVDTKFQRPVVGRVRFAMTPLMVIDLAVLVLPYWFDLRPLRILRLLRLSRYSARLRMLGRIVRDKREELIVSMAVAILLLVVCSTAMYYVERTNNTAFSSIPATMWWGVATLTTVGYGDVYPITAAGKILGAMVALIGVGMFALPAGILAGGFADALEREKKLRKASDGRCPTCGQPVDDHAH